MILELNDSYGQEVFEILCKVPFEYSTILDYEPCTTRHPGIEQMIKQIEAALDEDDDI